jgi:hypothetical protein
MASDIRLTREIDHAPVTVSNKAYSHRTARGPVQPGSAISGYWPLRGKAPSRHIVMTKQFLHRPYVVRGFQQMGGKRMAKGVACRQSDMHWVGCLNEALHTDQLELFYQPIAPIAGDSSLLHYEILLRLKDPTGKRVSLGAFLSAAERYELMPAVDRWMLKKVLEWLEGQPQDGERQWH